ncbi:5'-3' exonuclease XPN family [Giardia duodenalis]|uniref:5'-3' exonuclease XPN family n=1 Tax=Giardia intestinalis TaxID=5741 RepID=V6TUI0_GIAIN|nr:5'-3' exonuclease XPN family [Giardia intestinalis]
MGVARLFRWIYERYPFAITTPGASFVSRIDNLYIDFNALIHESIRKDSYIPFKFTEAMLFGEIADYIQVLVSTVQPRKRIFIATDGVAPDAKTKQQRVRRYMGSYQKEGSTLYKEKIAGTANVLSEAELLASRHIANGNSDDRSLPPQNVKTAISPGTLFMDRLHSFLIAFVAKNVDSEAPGWVHPSVTISGWDMCGEGEHKIMTEIKRIKQLEEQAAIGVDYSEKSFSEFFPYHESHCICGLDADIILLGLGVHVQNVYLLRLWQPPFVTDTLDILDSKKHPTDNELIVVDLSCFRECIVGELISNRFHNPKLLHALCCQSFPDSYMQRLRNCYPRLSKELHDDGVLSRLSLNVLQEAFVWSPLGSALIVDFIILTLFVGNDFLPEVPGMLIKNGSLDNCIAIYRELLADTYLLDDLCKNIKKIYHSNSTNQNLIQPSFLVTEEGDIRFDKIQMLYSRISQQTVIDSMVDDVIALLNLQIQVEKSPHVIGLNDDWMNTVTRECKEIVDYLNIKVSESDPNKKAIKKAVTLAMKRKSSIFFYYYRKYSQKFNALYTPFIEQTLTREQMNNRPPRLEAITDIFQDLHCIKNTPPSKDHIEVISSCLFEHNGVGFNIIKVGLLILDMYSNLRERERLDSGSQYYDAMTVDTLGVLEDIVSRLPLLQRLKPYHDLMRSYIRTTVMVIKYYMSFRGNPEWSWFFPYPFSPLISDLALYTTCIGSSVNTSSTFLQEFDDFKSEPLCTSPDISEATYDRLANILQSYKGPEFSFLNDRPKTALTQLCSVLSPEYLGAFIYKDVVTPKLVDLYKHIPQWDKIFILNETSSFESFYFTINLRRPTPYFVERKWFQQFTQYGDGFEKLFAAYYKDYPLGISEFFPLKKVYDYTTDITNLLPRGSLNTDSSTPADHSVASTKQYKALSHMLRTGCEIHIFRNLPSDSVVHKTLTTALRTDNCHLFCQPGQILGLNRSRFATDYELFHIPELSVMPRENYVHNYSPDNCSGSYTSLGVWLARYNKDLKLISEQPDEEYEIRLNQTTIWFTKQQEGLRPQFTIDHADIFDGIDGPDTYSSHLYLSIRGKEKHPASEVLDMITIRRTPFPIRYTGLRVYVPTISDTELSDKSIGFVICTAHTYKSQTLCLYPSLEQQIDQQHFESYYRHHGDIPQSWLNLNVFNEKTYDSFDINPELSSSQELTFLSSRTGASVTKLICGSPALTYGNSQVGILYGILIDGSIYLRKNLCGGFVDCTKDFVGIVTSQLFNQGALQGLLTEWFRSYWMLNKGVMTDTFSSGLAIVAPLSTLTSIDSSPVEMLTVHSELHGGLDAVTQCLHRILLNREYSSTGFTNKYSAVTPAPTLPLIPVALSMFHDRIQRSRILSALCPFLGLPMTAQMVEDFAAHLSTYTHVHVAVEGASKTITTRYTISERDILAFLQPHITKDVSFILSPQRLTELLVEKSLPLNSVSVRIAEYFSLEDTSITQPLVPLDVLALLCPCINYLDILERELNVIVTDEYFEFLVSKIDIEGSDKLFRNIGLTVKDSDWYTPGYFVLYEGKLWPTYLTVYTILLYKFSFPFSTRALKYILENSGRRCSLLPTTKDISPYYRYLMDDNSSEKFLVNKKSVSPSVRRAVYISDPRQIPAINLEPLFSRTKEHSYFPYLNGLDHLLSNMGYYVHGILVPLLYRQKVPLGTPALPHPFVSMAHRQLAAFSANGKATTLTKQNLTLHELLENDMLGKLPKITVGSLVLLNNSSISVPGAWAGSGQVGLVLRNDQSEILILACGTTSSTCGLISETSNLIRISSKHDINKICLRLVSPESSLNPCVDTLAYLDGSYVLSIFKSRCNVHHKLSFASNTPKRLNLKPLSTELSPISWCSTSLLESLFLRYDDTVRVFHCLRTEKRISMSIAISSLTNSNPIPSFTSKPIHITWNPKNCTHGRSTPTKDASDESTKRIVLTIPVNNK